MKILDSIIKICEENLDKENNWYRWKTINESKLPDGIILPEGNQYVKNISLKESLHSKWKNELDVNENGKIIEYYIKTWGSIKGNSKKTMDDYKSLSANTLIEKGKKGIASWSKALVIHNPKLYAIFDARVSCSLNSLQIIYSVDNKCLYPILLSQNNTITKANRVLKRISKVENWKIANEYTFYKEYLTLLKKSSLLLNTDISTVEMLLFAKAEELIDKALVLN